MYQSICYQHVLFEFNLYFDYRKVYLVGRRGPVQAACTTKELREVLGILFTVFNTIADVTY